MSMIFLDSNALLKLYLPEIGANWFRAFVVGQQVVISELALFECATVLRRLYTEGRYSKDETSDLFAQIIQDSTGYQVIPIGGEPQLNRLLLLILNLPMTLRIRTLDSIQLAAAAVALEAANSVVPPEPFVFVSSDRQLLQVAQFQGFATENPETHL